MLGRMAHFMYGGCNCSDGGGVVSIGVKRDRVAARVEEILAGTAGKHANVGDALIYAHFACHLSARDVERAGNLLVFVQHCGDVPLGTAANDEREHHNGDIQAHIVSDHNHMHQSFAVCASRALRMPRLGIELLDSLANGSLP